eukprot:1624324-Pyramimonas_sp.AAC.1
MFARVARAAVGGGQGRSGHGRHRGEDVAGPARKLRLPCGPHCTLRLGVLRRDGRGDAGRSGGARWRTWAVCDKGALESSSGALLRMTRGELH